MIYKDKPGENKHWPLFKQIEKVRKYIHVTTQNRHLPLIRPNGEGENYKTRSPNRLLIQKPIPSQKRFALQTFIPTLEKYEKQHKIS